MGGNTSILYLHTSKYPGLCRSRHTGPPPLPFDPTPRTSSPDFTVRFGNSAAAQVPFSRALALGYEWMFLLRTFCTLPDSTRGTYVSSEPNLREAPFWSYIRDAQAATAFLCFRVTPGTSCSPVSMPRRPRHLRARHHHYQSAASLAGPRFPEAVPTTQSPSPSRRSRPAPRGRWDDDGW